MDRMNPRSAYRCLGAHALPSVSASAPPFTTVPEKTKEVRFTIRTAAICMTGPVNGVPVTATTTVGLDFAVNSTSSPYVMEATPAILRLMRAIQSGGTAAGYVEYWG